MTKQLITAETSSKTEVGESNTLMGLGTPAYCLRFANPAEANQRLDAWRNGGKETVELNIWFQSSLK